MGKIGHVVDSVRISALTEPEAREVAELVDQARHGEVPSRTLSFPEVQWARAELDRLKAGQESALGALIPTGQLDAFEAKFARVEQAFNTGHGLLQLVRAPPLRLAGTVYENVFELPKDAQLEPMLELARKSKFDLIVVQDAQDKRYLAISERGRLNRVEKNAEAILAGDDYQHVRVIHVDDVVNSFFEGAMLIPRQMATLLENTFRDSVDGSLRRDVVKGVEQGIDQVNAPANTTPPKSRNTTLLAASAIGLGTVGLSTFVAVVPQVAVGIAGIAAVGTAYNAIRGAAARPDPYFILNVMGVQLAEAKRTKIDNLD